MGEGGAGRGEGEMEDSASAEEALEEKAAEAKSFTWSLAQMG